ncbi:MAG: alkaline phosphatase [Clostridia bacterium]|nr:alkaline phosphatase [Clostridia bacterium]
MKKTLAFVLAAIVFALAACTAGLSPADGTTADAGTELKTDAPASTARPTGPAAETSGIPDTQPVQSGGEVLPPDDDGEIKRVVIVGVDGAGSAFKTANTPNFDRIFANGAVTYSALTMYPSLSGDCWASCLHGVTPDKHWITNDNSASKTAANPACPSVFKIIREKEPDALLSSICNWTNVNYSIVEDDIGVYKYGRANRDDKVTEKACSYIAENDFRFMFVHLNDPDGALHGVGYGTSAHTKAVEGIDVHIGEIYDALVKKGCAGSTVFIVTTDHGGNGMSHGGWTDSEKYITFAVTGPGVLHGEPGDMNISDTAAIVLYSLGIDIPDWMTGRVPTGIFDGITAEPRPYESH